ncbi:hypothetical protein FH972_013435 [Carpinus fangiana]|uniref:Uncharacterized protein n=1 Tax=Carpinus fangiana TaxID=176857 RepID=A0A5N6RA69_9ROSI|nr:hypothetical protein FH972_013435 [Carpinus fangiana]
MTITVGYDARVGGKMWTLLGRCGGGEGLISHHPLIPPWVGESEWEWGEWVGQTRKAHI